LSVWETEQLVRVGIITPITSQAGTEVYNGIPTIVLHFKYFGAKYIIFEIVLSAWSCRKASLFSSQPCVFIPYTSCSVFN